MSPAHTYKVQAPDGSWISRKTERTYTHVVVGRRPLSWPKNPGKWESLGWCGREDLASRKIRESTYYLDVMILEVPQLRGPTA